MPNLIRAQILPYGVALLADAIALLVTWLFQPWLGSTCFALFYPAVMMSALSGGLGAGVFASILAGLATLYFFLPPSQSLILDAPADFLQLGMWLVVSLLITGLSSRYRRAQKGFEKTVQALRESQELFERFMSHSPLTAFIKDEAGRYHYVSPVVERQFDRPLAEWIGKTDGDLFPSEIAQSIRAHDQAVLTAGRAMEMEETVPRPEGVCYYMSVKFPLQDRSGNRMIAGMSLNITEWRQAQAALRESETRFSQLASTNLIGFLTWDLEGKIIDANDTFLNMVGYTREDLQHGRVRWDEIMPPTDQQVNGCSLEELQQTGICTPFETEYQRQDGTRVSMLIGSAISEGSSKQGVSFVLDLTERKRAQAALQASEARYRLLAEALPQLIWTTDAAGRVEYCNPYWYRYTGLAAVQTLGLGWRLALHPDDLIQLWRQWQQATETGVSFNVECRVRAADGAYRWFLAAIGPAWDGDGQIERWVGTAIEIEAIKRAEAERTDLLARERAARAEAETANRIKDEFLAVLSHELRTPLNPILGWTKLLRTRQFNAEKTEKALEVIERNATLQTQLIEDLLDISRILRGKLKLTIAPVNLVTTIEAAIETVRLAAEAKSIDLQFTIDDFELAHNDPSPSSSPSTLQKPKPLVSGDITRLQQVIWNLLSNAVKFTPVAGRIEVRLQLVQWAGIDDLNSSTAAAPLAAPFSLAPAEPQLVGQAYLAAPADTRPDPSQASGERLPRSYRYAQITVTDTGKGIRPDFLPYVFEYFRQADGSTTRSFGGLGLGLAIARHLVELHGGTIRAASEGEDKGATFVVRLPLLITKAAIQSQREAMNRADDLSGLRILVVDDETDSRELLQVILSEQGAQVTAVGSAVEALQVLQETRPALLITDIGMPEIDGYELIQRIQARLAQGETLPAIALTAYAAEADQQRALEAGFQRHLAKPIEPAQLIRAILSLTGAPGNAIAPELASESDCAC
jgi:PAS domain S-box-containing protein